ncbi:DUF695 domain-containing protein [Corynebacterium sp. TAE3-ERU12]|uniref:DUF695 domain-containing protein n=1 Tax=Corynebacterium sp. TAE3-ERU12 TaxID=2849491 RepID=UPI001C444A89|nr:DUF695 domain-containing protein [Corynebacterium sp. TAE3-ERU12]MBV7294328.1 DUF695 domain-containing protein [Corynebacterium sp. TAE3-ERU12]
MTDNNAQPQPTTPPSPEAIAALWDWWNQSGAQRLDAMFTGTGDPVDVQQAVGKRVADIDPRLAWGFGPGNDSRHLFTITAGGDPELRPVARRVIQAAPADDEVWAITDMRQPDPSASITWAGHTIDPAEAVVETMVGTTIVGVRLYHPVFGELLDAVEPGDESEATEQAERDVTQIGFMLLQLTLGEEALGLWLGQIIFSREVPEESIPLAELPGVVAQVADTCPAWYGLEGESDGSPVHVTARGPLSPLVDPLLDEHIAVQLLYSHVDEQGLPTQESITALDELGQDMADCLGDKGAFVAAETCDGVRLLHFYVRSDAGLVEEIRAKADTWQQGEHEVHAAHDPAWLNIGHLRV